MSHCQAQGILWVCAFGHGNLRPGIQNTANTFQLGARQGGILTRELKEELHSHRFGAAAQKYLCAGECLARTLTGPKSEYRS
jgi:hypothetical protein